MRSLGMAATVLVVLLVVEPLTAYGQQIHRNGFETSKTYWIKGGADVAFDEISHAVTDQVWHDGQRSEAISIQAKAGSFIYYNYATGRVPISEEMSASMWLKAN